MPEVSDKKVIAVVGGLGNQGSGLVHAIVRDGQFKARILTRDPNSDKAKNSVSKYPAGSYELVAADSDNVETLVKAFTGAWGAFCLTNFWEHHSAEREIQQAKNLAEACKAAGIKHAIWSTLEDTRSLFKKRPDIDIKALKGDMIVPHFDAKGGSNHFFIDAGVPTTMLNTCFYSDNWLQMMPPRRGEDGSLSVTVPVPADRKFPSQSVKDIGGVAYGVFKNSSQYVNKSVGTAAENLTIKEYVDSIAKVLGEPIAYNAVPNAVFASFGFPGADDLANMFTFFSEFNKEMMDNRDIALAKKLNPEMETCAEFFQKNAAVLKKNTAKK